jgi:hypothetical protein
MMAACNETLEGKTCLISGSGNVAQHTAEKIIELGGKVLTFSDSSGYIYDPEGIDQAKLAFVKRLKIIKRGRIHPVCPGKGGQCRRCSGFRLGNGSKQNAFKLVGRGSRSALENHHEEHPPHLSGCRAGLR